MYRIDRRVDDFTRYLLIDDGANRVEIVPERGALVTSFRVGERELLYLDPATFADRSKNVRGGIPVLFPMAGKLAHDHYFVDGREFTMKQHGFARSSAWSVIDQKTESAAQLTLALTSNEATRAEFPWDFEVRLTFVLAGATLQIEQHYRNNSREPMPLHAGFHPYFLVPDAQKAQTKISTDATRAFDNTRGAFEPFAGFDLTRPEVDLHLLDHTPRHTTLMRPDGLGVRIDMDAAFTTLVVWTLTGKDYVCLEPWTAPGNALNTRTGLLIVPPGGVHEARVEITGVGPSA
jgi:galactose mutarotase-like enzyme